MVTSGALMLLGYFPPFMGLPMNDSSSGISLLSGAALAAGVVGFILTMKSIL